MILIETISFDDSMLLKKHHYETSNVAGNILVRNIA